MSNRWYFSSPKTGRKFFARHSQLSRHLRRGSHGSDYSYGRMFSLSNKKFVTIPTFRK